MRNDKHMETKRKRGDMQTETSGACFVLNLQEPSENTPQPAGHPTVKLCSQVVLMEIFNTNSTRERNEAALH